MNCDEVNEMLAAFALDALDPDEVEAIRDHLEGCGLHAEAEELRATAVLLAEAVEERAPSAGLKARLMAEATGQVEAVPAPTAVPTPIEELATRMAMPPSQSRWRAVAPYAMAAVFAVVSIGLLAWNVALLTDDDGDGTRTATFAQSNGAGGEVTYFEDEGLVVFRLHDVSGAPEAHTHQAWALEDGGARSLGVFEAGADGTVALLADLEDADGVAISVEPDGGSEQPTTEPILVANF